ncbi:hypothetical protein JOE38_002693 [Clavibacter michiganensis]|uniref:DUF6445 family protein n=1 Tax=Clavibacter michiganensis TaxID=28447 RepID=UPI00195847CF|nr:DUF6445 family protein [Clavibacter michiganensis]MBM7412870.1 hypothetical protein [Clavibacter michiganensis]
MKSDIIVIDDFYKDPDSVRAMALGSDFMSGAAHNYPGWQSTGSFAASPIKDAIEKAIGAEILADGDRFTWGAFRLITHETGAKTKVHADSGCDWAAMVYLTPSLPTGTGTGFYQHRETKLYGPPTDSAARDLGYRNAEEFEREVVRRDMADLSKWDIDTVVSARYNRLVLFRGGNYYHAPMGGAGEVVETARLTQNFFFDEVVR